jgi:hypothetical protein
MSKPIREAAGNRDATRSSKANDVLKDARDTGLGESEAVMKLSDVRLLAMFGGLILTLYGVSRRTWPGTIMAMAGLGLASGPGTVPLMGAAYLARISSRSSWR